MKKRYWEGDDGKARKPKMRWASYRHGYAEDGGQHIFRWGEGIGANQKVVMNEAMAEALAHSYVKNIKEIPQDGKDKD